MGVFVEHADGKASTYYRQMPLKGKRSSESRKEVLGVEKQAARIEKWMVEWPVSREAYL